ncbi:cell wall hydrolase [Oricola thermophila]|uniref:Cell wall hydrolase n=1 Tax=Oricola thermophila TaxID=2742145 RepID=A0A6N1VFQ0_9HYPH|nr:cell wall hydrolase [Oricola thermophila]QKV19780.1 cell wall hydrolase [Oricola thermophila]
MNRLLTRIAVMMAAYFFMAASGAALPAIHAAMQVFHIPAAHDLPRTMLAHPPIAYEMEATCLTAALYHEARGEPREGQLAVARVILNRMRSKAYPDTVCGVVYQGAEKPFRCQFSFACDRIPDFPREVACFRELHALAREILENGMPGRLLPGDPREWREAEFHEITHYHATYVSPYWADRIGRVGQIGRHVFYRSERVARSL